MQTRNMFNFQENMCVDKKHIWKIWFLELIYMWGESDYFLQVS